MASILKLYWPSGAAAPPLEQALHEETLAELGSEMDDSEEQCQAASEVNHDGDASASAN